ncbi:hypothetical protein AAG607_12210 [Citromicrobium bathyomarinum]|uniref:hypothetical protein n=1 Tax=Citromicrobium bathyomarinum TaxID=72174 RepID=UPI00315A8750
MIARAAERYRKRLATGDFIVRDSAGNMFWQSSGAPAAAKTVRFMIEAGQIFERDTDIFGEFAHGQTIGRELCDG